MVLDDDSEEEPEQLFPDSGDKAASEHRESRKEREDKLKKMMEEDADGMHEWDIAVYSVCTELG